MIVHHKWVFGEYYQLLLNCNTNKVPISLNTMKIDIFNVVSQLGGENWDALSNLAIPYEMSNSSTC